MTQIILEARSLAKRIDGQNIISGIQLAIHSNETYCILGSPQSGKTVLLELLSTAQSLSAGDLFIDGVNAKNNIKLVRSSIAYIKAENEFDNSFSVRENLSYYAKFFPKDLIGDESRIDEVLKDFDLDDKDYLLPKELSLFELRKLSFARAILHRPKLLIIDQVSNFLKGHEQRLMWNILADMKAKYGLTIIFATHSYQEAQQLADRVGILSKAKIIIEGKPDELIVEHIGNEVLEFYCKEEDMEYTLTRLGKTYDYRLLYNRVHLFLKEGQDAKKLLESVASDDVSIRKPYLGDLVIKYHPHAINVLERL